MPEITADDPNAQIRTTVLVALWILRRKVYGADITASS
jgi:hypothetical protein